MSKNEKGVALIIALFAIMLISGLGVALVMSTGTETGITANYKLYTQAYYASLAGMEEGRTRMIPVAPDFINVTPFTNVPQPTPAVYITNPAAGETVNPDPATSNTTRYRDAEVLSEFPDGISFATTASNQIGTNSATALPYKWIRITPKTEWAVNMDIDGANGITKPEAIYLDGNLRQNLFSNIPLPWMPVTPTPVWLITALSLLPNGTTRLLQIEAAQPPKINADGAIDSLASVNINGNFSAKGSYCHEYFVADPQTGQQVNLCENGVGTCRTFGSGKTKQTICPDMTQINKDYCNQSSTVPGIKTAGGLSPTPTSPPYTSNNLPNYTVQGNGSGGNANYATNAPFPYNLDAIVQAYGPIAQPITEFAGASGCTYGSSCTASVTLGTLPSYPTCSGQPNPNAPYPCFGQAPPYNDQPVVAFANVGPGHEVHLSGSSSGSGILVVNGDLTLTGGFQWFGQIIVTGKLTFLGGGSTKTNIFGSVIAGQDVQGDSTTSGGSVEITYNQCAFRPNQDNMALKILSFREK